MVASQIAPSSTMLVYFDTTMWNLLCNQGTDASRFNESLLSKGFRVVLGINAYVELLNSFFGKRPERARPLLSCLDRFLEVGTPIVDSWEKWLIDESKIVLGKHGRVSLFLDDNQQKNMRTWTKGLLRHNPPNELQQRLILRKEQTSRLRKTALRSLANQPDILEDLRAVPPVGLASFLDNESKSMRGRNLLARYLPQVFASMEEPLPMAPEPLAEALLESKSNKAAHAIVRNDIYRNWQAANLQDIKFAGCVPEDSYHVVNASYCGVFVTEDKDGQADTASYAVPEARTFIYVDRSISVGDWLPELL